eukprot:4819272-Alexandrium_andersonii.AAC.1
MAIQGRPLRLPRSWIMGIPGGWSTAWWQARRSPWHTSSGSKAPLGRTRMPPGAVLGSLHVPTRCIRPFG